MSGKYHRKFIENKGAGVHHVAFAIEDGVANALAEAESKEIRLIDKARAKVPKA